MRNLQKHREDLHEQTEYSDSPNNPPVEGLIDIIADIDDTGKTDKCLNNNKEKQYICGECGKSFDDWVSANNHVMAHNSAESAGQPSVTTFKCDQCDHAYLGSDELRNHKVTVHSKYGCIYVCNGCDYQTSQITIF